MSDTIIIAGSNKIKSSRVTADYNPLQLFKDLIAGRVLRLQNFNDNVISGRVSARVDKVDGGAMLYAERPDGTFEDYVLSSKILDKGKWVVIPPASEHVNFPTAFTKLMQGECDYIRNDEISDQRYFLKRKPGENQLVKVTDGSIVSLSNSSLFSTSWMMIKLPRG